jgi:GSH-dependent disulfide-bond oxidoreductase
VIDDELRGRDWMLASDYSIADIALVGWINAMIKSGLGEQIEAGDFKNVGGWLQRVLERPAVKRGLVVTAPNS